MRQAHSDGSVTVRATITNSALNKISTYGKTQSSAPNTAPKGFSRSGWPPEAIAAWLSWGKNNPVLFFRIWIDLAPPGFKAEGPSL